MRLISVRLALTALSLSVLLSSLGTSIANVALPTLATAFAAPFHHVQWVVLAYLLAMTAAIVSAGRLGDLVARRRLLLGGIVVFTLASALGAAAPTLLLLIAARGAQGLGAAVLMALSMPLITEVVAKEKMGRALGLLGTMSALGTALGPSMGGALIAAFGWRAIFLVNIPPGVLAFLLAWRHLPRHAELPNADRTPFDMRGTVLLAVILACYTVAMTVGDGNPALTAMLLLAAALVLVLFARVEATAPAPLIQFAIVRDPVLRAAFVMNGLVTTVVMATLVVGPFYLSRGLALDAALVGLVMSAGPVIAALTSVPAGALVDRFGKGRATVASLMAMAGGAATLSLLPERFGVPGYVAPLVVVTAGYAMFQASNGAAVMRDLRHDQRGVVSGMLSLSRNLGLITGASLMGAIFAAAAGTRDFSAAHPTAVAAGMRTTFAVAAVLLVAALLMALSRGRVPAPEASITSVLNRQITRLLSPSSAPRRT
jgi:MFS family permease